MDRDNQAQHYLARLEENPHDLTTLRELERLYARSGEWEQLVAMLMQRAEDLGRTEASARFLLEAGRIADLKLQDQELGGALLDRCVTMASGTAVDPEARIFLLAHQEQWETLLSYFGEAVESVPDDRQKSRLYLRMGSILEELVEDLEEADSAYKWALELDKANTAARWSRQSLARRSQDWPALAELLYEEVESSENVERQLEALLDLGDVYRERLGQDDEAAQCYANVYEFDPTNERARQALEALGHAVESAAPAAVPTNGEQPHDAVVGFAVEEDDGEELVLNEDSTGFVEASEASEQSAGDEEEEEDPRATVLLDGEQDDSQASDVQPASEPDELDHEEAQELSEEEDAPDSAGDEDDDEDRDVEVLDAEEMDLVEPPATPPVAEEDEEEAGWETRYRARLSAGSVDDLVGAARLAVRHDASSQMLLAVWRSALAAGLHRELWGKSHFLVSDKSVWETVLSETDDAPFKARVAIIDLADPERGRELAGGDERIAEFLDDIDAGRDNWRKFQRALEQRYDNLGEDEKARLVYTRMANVAAALGDSDKEMDALRRLDRQISNDPTVQGHLKQIYAAGEKWPMYVDIIKSEVASVPDDDPAEKIDLLREMIHVYRDHMNHDMMVVNTYKEILDIDPENLEAIDALAALYDKLNRSSELVAMLQQKAELVKKPAKKVEIWSQIAELFLEKFRNQAEAIKAYEQVLEIEPYHAQAIAFLKEMYEKRRDWEKLIDVHKREIATFDSAADKVAGLKEVASLATDKLRKPEIATELWLEVRAVDPNDADALDALETLYEKSKEYDSLGEILETKAEVTADPAERMKLYQKMGLLFSDRLGDPDRAARAWRKALELDPDDLKAQKSLERLLIDNRRFDELEQFYGEKDAWSDLVRLLGTLSGTIKEDDVKIDLLLRSARIWAEQLGDTGRAERDLERVLQLDAENERAALLLEPIYRAADDAAKLKDVYEVILSHRSEPEERRDYVLKLANLHAQELGDPATAFNWYAKAFEETPESVSDVTALEAAAGASGRWSDLVQVYQGVLQGAALDEDATRSLRLRVGRVLSEELEELDEALTYFQAVLAEQDDNLAALGAVESIYQRAERWDDLMSIYQRRIELTESENDRVDILAGMALIAERQKGDIATAIARHREALSINPDYEPSLQQLHRLYANREEYPELADVIRREIEIIEGRAQARARAAAGAVDAGQLLPGGEADSEVEIEVEAPISDEFSAPEIDADVDAEGHELGDVSSSDVEGLEESSVSEPSLAEDSSDVSEAQSEPSLDEPSAAPAATGAVYTDDEVERLVDLHFELGVVSKDHLGDYATAVNSLGTVLRWRPNHDGARGSIEDFLADADHRVYVARVLEPVYEVHGNWQPLVGALEAQLEASRGDEAVELLERIASIHLEELGDPQSAFEAYGRLLEHDSGHAGARSQVMRIADALEGWDAFVELYEAIVVDVNDPPLQVEYYFDIADAYADRLDDPTRAREFYEKVLGLRPTDERALEELEGLFTRTEQWRELEGVLVRRLQMTEDPYEAQDLKFRMALLHEEVLDDPRRAIEIYQEILADDAQSLAAVESLNRLYASEGLWADLAENLQVEHELVADHAKHGVRNRLALVLEQKLHEPDAAVDLYESVVAEDPENQVTLEALERMMYSDSAPRGRISRILEPLYIEHDQFDKLIAALEVQVEASAENSEKVALLHRVAVLQETRAQNLSTAFRTYSRALHWDVDNEATLQHLYRIAQQTSSYEDLVAVFENEVEEQNEPAVKRDLLRRAATVYRDALLEPDKATARLHDVLEYYPEDLETIEELEAVYRATQDWANLVTVLGAKADLVDDVEQKKHLLNQAGTAYEEFLEQPHEAMDVYNRILELDPADLAAIDRLEVLFANHDRWDDLLGIYDRKVGLADNDEARKDLYYAMGAIYREALEQPHDAIDVFRNILGIDDRELAAWQQLDELYQQTEQWNELLDVLEAELALTAVPDDALTLKYRIGRLWEAELHEVVKAIETYSDVLTHEPEHAPTTAALEGLIERGEQQVLAAEVLVPIYRDSQQWEKLIHIYRLLIGATEDVDGRLDLYTEIGTIFEHRLDDPASAFETYAQALEVLPGRVETLNTLERLASMLDGWEVLVEILDAQLHDIADYDAVRTLNLRIARIQEDELQQPDEAIARFKRVLELEPDDQEAILALDRLYQRQGYWEDLAEILRTRIMNAQDDELLELRLRLGGVYQEALDDAAQALETYQSILLEDPENPLAIERLEQMFMSGMAVTQVAAILEPYYSARNEHEKLISIYVQRLELLDDPRDIYDVWMLIAQTFLSELDDKTGALSAYGNALAQQPEEQHVVDEIMRLAEETGAWAEAAEKLADALESEHITDEAALRLFYALATIFDRHLGLFEEAEASYLNVLQFDPGEPRALEALDRIYEGQGRWEELADILARRIEGLYDEDLIVDLQFRRAQLFQGQLAELDKAVDTYHEILNLQPVHPQSLQMLAQIHYQRQEWQPLYDVLERQAEIQDDPDARAGTYAQMAQIAEEALERRDDAVELWNRVLQLQPDSIDALQELRRLYLGDERWSDLVGVLEREVELTHDPDEQLVLWESLGTIWADRLGNEGQALDCWNRVLEIDPYYLAALEALRELYTRALDYESLSKILYRMLEHEDLGPSRKLDLWMEQGEILGDHLMQPERAIEAWRQVLAFDPTNETALDNLERVFFQESRWEEAAAILEMKLDTIEDSQDRVDLLLRIADIWETKILDRDRAADFYEGILEVEPTNEQAGLQLESIYREQASPDAYAKLANLYLDRSGYMVNDPEAFLEARRASARVFEDHLQQPEGSFLVLLTAFTSATYEDEQLLVDLGRLAAVTGQWAELIAQVEDVLREIGDVLEAADIHKMVGRWQSEELNQPEEAVYHLQRALAIEPENIEVMDDLERLYREIAAWEELSQILGQRVQLSADPDEQVEIWRKLGELYELQMGDVDRAINSYRNILDVDPSDILAIESLERIYEAYDRWRELIQILQQKADATYDPDDMVGIRYRIAQIWEERLDDIDNAILTYRDILAADQTHMPSLRELERIFMSHQRWQDLLDVYDQQLALTHEPVEQVTIYGRQAALYEDAFDDMERAIEAYSNILMVDPENIDAITNLERLYRQHERWFDLVDALQRHADVTVDRDPATATEVLNELARTQRDQVNDPNAAIEAFTRSLHLDNEQAEIWSELASLFEDTANWSSAIEAYQALIDLVGDPNYRVDVYNRIGFLYDANLQDDENAERAYLSALDLDAGNEATLLALRDLYTRRGDWHGSIRVLKQAEETSRDLAQKARYLCEIGKVYEHQLEDAVSALHYYETALENDPTVTEAAAPLIDLYVSEQRWERAAPLLDRLVHDGVEGSDADKHRRYFQHARVSQELGSDEAALASYRHAYELDPAHTDTLRGLANLLYKSEEWEQAFKIFQALQFNHADALGEDELVDVYFRSGDVKQRVGERHKAIQMYQKALDYNPRHAPSLNALIDTFEADGNFEQVVSYTQFLLEAETEPTVRFALLSKIGDIWATKLKNPTNATQAYLDALDLDPTSVVVLRKLLDIYTKAKQWSEAVEILKRIIEQEPDPGKQAKYYYTVAVIYRDEVHDVAEAVASFDAALDADVKMLKAFEAIDRIWTEQKSWKDLERAYRRMLRRVAENDDGSMEKIKILLWQNLGEIYRSRLGHVKSAIGAYEAAVGLNPADEKLRLILAELYERSGENPDGAIDQHKELIKIDPFRIDSYRALWKAYMQKKQYDRAWCMAGALSFLQNANDQEEKFYRQYLGQNLKVAKGTFNQEMWKLVYHSEEDMLMSMILSVLANGLRGWYAANIKDWGVHKKKDLLSPDEQLMFCKIYTYAARTMGLMPAPLLYLKSDQALGMRNANGDPPAFIVGADMMQGKGDRELAFTIGKQLCWVRPEHYLGSIGYPTEFLRLLFMATMHTTDPSLGLDRQLGPQGQEVINAIMKMPGPMLLQLQKLMKTYLQQGKNPNLSAWLTAVDHTTSRMGLLLCGDLHQAASAIKNDTNPVGKSTVKEKIRELVLFGISDEYFDLRTQLGLSIDSQ